MPAKTNTKRPVRKNQSRRLSLKSVPKFNKKIALILLVLIAAFGAWRIFFAAAAPNNCQSDSGINVCDVDMTAGGTDTILSVGPEALALHDQKWGMYYGTNFRAPTGPLRGAVPVHRLANEKYSWHEWVTDAQKKEKEAKYDGNKVYEGIVFYAWTGPGEPGAVPVYRMTRGGSGSQSIFSTDKAWIDKMIAENANNPDGWRIGTTMPAIAFYAYPPGYTVANKVNPYDCSIRENFLSDRCKMQREALLAAEKAGTLPKTPACPTTYDAYKKAPFPGQFDAACQKKWNDYARQQPSQTAPPSQQPTQTSPTGSKPKPPANPASPVAALPTEQQRLAQFYQAINDCTAKGWHFYDFKCNQFSKEANAWFAGIDQLRQACIDRPGSQTWIPETNTCRENGGGGALPGPAPAPADPNLIAYFQAVNQAKIWCSNLNPRQDVDPATLKCKPFSLGISVPPRNTWLCIIRGQHSVPKRGWIDISLSKDIAAVNKATAVRLCDEWKSSYNRQDRYRGFYATIVE